jgi:hypothetical protein
MTELRGSEELSKLAREGRLVRIEVPEVEEVEVYLVRLEDGRLVARTGDELSKGIE